MAEIRDRIHGFIETLRKGNVDAAVAYFATDGVYQESGALPLIGHEAIRTCLSRFVALGREWNFVIDEYIAAEGDGKAAVAYRFLIDNGEQLPLEMAGCAIVTCTQDRFDLWREYSG